MLFLRDLPLPPNPSTYFGTTFNMMNSTFTHQTVPLPTVEGIKINLKPLKDCYLFYSGPGCYARKARQWAKWKKAGHMVLAQLWKNEEYPNTWQNDEFFSREFFALASRAMAELASGTVYVVLPSDTQGTNWLRGTVWDLYEWPHLSSDVTKVIRINPVNDQEETIKEGSALPQQRVQRHRGRRGQSRRQRRHRHARRRRSRLARR